MRKKICCATVPSASGMRQWSADVVAEPSAVETLGKQSMTACVLQLCIKMPPAAVQRFIGLPATMHPQACDAGAVCGTAAIIEPGCEHQHVAVQEPGWKPARALPCWSCKTLPTGAAATADASTNMALFSQAGLLGIRPKLFAAAPERFEADDFYR